MKYLILTLFLISCNDKQVLIDPNPGPNCMIIKAQGKNYISCGDKILEVPNCKKSCHD